MYNNEDRNCSIEIYNGFNRFIIITEEFTDKHVNQMKN